MKLLLVRHGETDWNRQGRFQGHSDAGLTTLGMWQAQAVAQALGHYHPSALYSSPLLRAMQTAELVGRALGLEVTVLEGLKEADLGELEGLDSQTMRTRYGQFYARWRQDPATATMPGGESLAQVQERAWGAVQQMARAHPEEAVVALSHDFAIRAIVCRVLGLPLALFRRVRIGLASVSVLELGDGGGVVTLLNDRCSLPVDEAAATGEAGG